MRASTVERTATEVGIPVRLDPGGTGTCGCVGGVGHREHMPEQFGRHLMSNISVHATRDHGINDRYTVVDMGIVLGKAFTETGEGNPRVGSGSGEEGFASSGAVVGGAWPRQKRSAVSAPCIFRFSEVPLSWVPAIDAVWVAGFDLRPGIAPARPQAGICPPGGTFPSLSARERAAPLLPAAA